MQNKFTTGSIKYVTGTCAEPHVSDNRLVVVFADTSGTFGNEHLSRWKILGDEYRRWWRSAQNFVIGKDKRVQVQSDTQCAIYLLKDENGNVDLKKVEPCLVALAKECSVDRLNVHIQKDEIANFSELEPLLISKLVNAGVKLWVYSKLVEG